jgi:hypothetical protein
MHAAVAVSAPPRRRSIPLVVLAAAPAAALALAGALASGRAVALGLVLVTLAAAAGAAVLARRLASPTAGLVAALLCAGAALGAGAFVASSHARTTYPAEWKLPELIGLRPRAARELLLRHGPVSIEIRRVFNLPKGRVGRVHGETYYGTYSRESRLVLDVGR